MRSVCSLFLSMAKALQFISRGCRNLLVASPTFPGPDLTCPKPSRPRLTSSLHLPHLHRHGVQKTQGVLLLIKHRHWPVRLIVGIPTSLSSTVPQCLGAQPAHMSRAPDSSSIAGMWRHHNLNQPVLPNFFVLSSTPPRETDLAGSTTVAESLEHTFLPLQYNAERV
jgi:hypothetical protein